MKKHVNIPIFVPHLACPNDCVFCNQRTISATEQAPDIETTDSIIKKAISTLLPEQTCEIAFFGGSFTGIERERMCEYLDCAQKYAERIEGIRMSTRPDYISPEILDILSRYKVRTIELGMQSMNADVLKRSNRGHTPEDTVRATALIREYGFSPVLQMMTGLPGDSDEGALETARRCIALRPDAVRIYPCIVLKGTELHRMYLRGEYEAPTLDASVALCARLIPMFEAAGIPIIRLGLFSEASMMNGQITAGPYHPAFRELCENRIYLGIMEKALVPYKGARRVRIEVAPGCVSKTAGQKRINIALLEREMQISELRVCENMELMGREVSVLPG